MALALMSTTSAIKAGPRKLYTLLGPDSQFYASPYQAPYGGHSGVKLFGKLDCPSALMHIRRGHYVDQRVFFASFMDALALGYRACRRCSKDFPSVSYPYVPKPKPTPQDVEELWAGEAKYPLGFPISNDRAHQLIQGLIDEVELSGHPQLNRLIDRAILGGVKAIHLYTTGKSRIHIYAAIDSISRVGRVLDSGYLFDTRAELEPRWLIRLSLIEYEN